MREILGRIIGGFRGLFERTRIEQELDDELRGFLEAGVEQKIRSGMGRAEAMRAARLELGSAAAVKDRVRDAGWESLVESFWRDVRYAVRMLRRSPGFTAAAVLTLALGIGATTAIFSLMDAVLLKSLPVRNPEELTTIRPLHYQAFQAFQRHTEIFAGLCGTSGVTPLDAEIRNGPPERAAVSLVSGAYFSVLGVPAAIGRTFTVADDRIPGAHPVAVASYGYWERRFGRDAGIINSVVRISGQPITIVGVAPPGFFGEQIGAAPDLWVPLTMWGQLVPGRNLLQSPGTAWLRTIGRVQPGVSTSGTNPALTRTFQQVLTELFGPDSSPDDRRSIARATVTLEPAGKGISSVRTQFARPLRLLMGAVVLVLLIACANIANLLLARAAARRREIDLRLALGMSRGRLIRQLLTESLVLAGLGGAMGLAIAWAGREALLRLISADGSRLPIAVATDARLLAFVAVVSLATAIFFGLAPAWQSARPGIIRSLVGRGGPEGRRSQRLSALLVVAQVAVSLVLMMGAGLFLRTIANLRAVDLGFAPEQLLVVDLNSHAATYRGERAIALSRRLLERIGNLPGVSSASLSEHGVVTASDSGTNLMHARGQVAGPEGFPRTRWDVVGPRYFSTIGVPLLAGRDFREQDGASAPLVVAINEEMARVLFAGGSAIGQRLVWGDSPNELEIVAVAADVKLSGPRAEPQPRFYLPYLQMPAIRPSWIMTRTRFLVRARANPMTLAPALRQLIPAADPRLSVTSAVAGPELVNRALVQERMVAILLVAFGTLAAGLACLGLYGLIAYHVVQRTAEIGIRMALGAGRGQVLRVTLQRGLTWIALGVAAGIPLALGASRVAQGLLFGLRATDAATLTGAAAVMVAVGLLAAYIPARRASRIDPPAALRCD